MKCSFVCGEFTYSRAQKDLRHTFYHSFSLDFVSSAANIFRDTQIMLVDTQDMETAHTNHPVLSFPW